MSDAINPNNSEDRKQIAYDFIEQNDELKSSDITDRLNQEHPNLEFTDFEIRGYKAWITMKKDGFKPRNQGKKEKRDKAIKIIQENPNLSSEDIVKKLNEKSPNEYKESEIRGYKAQISRSDKSDQRTQVKKERRDLAISYMQKFPELTSAEISKRLNELFPDKNFTESEIRGYRAWRSRGNKNAPN